MKRITPEMVTVAYKATGAKPAVCCYAERREHGVYCCGVAVMAIQQDPSLVGSSNKIMAWGRVQYGHEYRSGFENGFDGNELCLCGSDRCKEGYADGLACAAAVFAH